MNTLKVKELYGGSAFADIMAQLTEDGEVKIWFHYTTRIKTGMWSNTPLRNGIDLWLGLNGRGRTQH